MSTVQNPGKADDFGCCTYPVVGDDNNPETIPEMGKLFFSCFDMFKGTCMFMHSSIYLIVAGWWFGTCFIFPYIGNNHPN